jgi:tripartite ATP-independent transporter DctP family solute receptor
MKTRTALFILAMVVSLGLLFAGAEKAMSADKITIRIGSPFKAGHILCDAAEKFKELVEKGSGGAMEVQTQFGTASEEDINDWCSQGKIEMQSNGHRAIEIFAPQYFFFNAPYVMKDLDHFMRVWEGSLGKNAREQMVKNGNVMYLGIVYRGLRQTTSKKPLYTPADVSGMKLRLPTVKTWIAVWKEMGAEPIPIPLPELYKSLKEGRADASEGDLTQISSFKLDEVQSHLTITNHLVQTGGVSINKSFFDKLAKGNQDLILKACKEATNWADEKLKSGETKLLVDLQRKGMQVVIPDADAFREKGKPAVEALFQKEWPVTTWKEVLAQ